MHTHIYGVKEKWRGMRSDTLGGGEGRGGGEGEGAAGIGIGEGSHGRSAAEFGANNKRLELLGGGRSRWW